MTFYEITMKIVPDDGVKLFTGVMKVESNNTISEFYQTPGNIPILDTTSVIGTIPNNPTYTVGTGFGSGGIYLTTVGNIRTDVDATVYVIYNFGGLVKSNSETDITSTIVSITVVSGCFNEGTKILCLNNKKEEYVPIEQLRKGDVVKSYKYGYRKIELIGKNKMINNSTNFRQCMYTMKKTDTNELIEDLTVTGGHSILVDDLGENKELNEQLLNGQQMIEDKYLLLSAVSNKFEKVTDTNEYTYYHFILENNGNDEERFGVWANGVLTETPNKNFFVSCGLILL
jgi:hypothetical protein